MTNTTGPKPDDGPVAAATRKLFEVLRRTPFVPRDIAIAAAEIKSAMNPVAGSDLAFRRKKAGISQPTLGRCWLNDDHPNGVSKAYVGRVEKQDAPTRTTVDAYMAALRTATNRGEAYR